MTASSETLPATVLERMAVVYVRQSTPMQVQVNLESQRQQYALADVARDRGCRSVEIIDDDLGRSAGGAATRPRFDRLVAWLCAGKVGAVLCLDASRLARSGRDWHHLLELCGLVEARVIDQDGVYDPCLPNDRLLLGMKGTISEFETGVLRARMLGAARAKAKRGELRISVPIGYVWHREAGLGLDPDQRLQGRHPPDLRTLRPTRQRAAGPPVAAGRPGPFPPAKRSRWRYRAGLGHDPLPQRDLRADQPLLRRRLRLRQKQQAHRDRRRAGAAQLRPWQAGR